MASQTREAILASYGRQGWNVISSTDKVGTARVFNQATGGYDEKPQLTGEVEWHITSPDGKHHDTITVRKAPSTEPPGRGGVGQDLWDVTAGPKSQLPEPPKTPTPAGQLEQITDPNTGKIIKMRDPVTGTVIDLPDASTQRPTVVQGQRGQLWSWDGQTLKELAPGTPEKPTLVQGQGGAIYAFDGTTLKTLQPGKPEPKEGDTRPNVKDGYNVTETHLGGDWVVTKYGDPAKPGTPTEGQTRPSVREGFNVTETYQGGSWNVTDVGTRETPLTPTTVTTVTDQPYITRTDETGKIVQEPNPNYQPKTRAQIAARTGQLQQVMQSKGADIQKRVDARTITPEEGLREWNAWYDQTISAEMAGLQAAAEDEAYQRGKEQAATRTAAYNAAEAAGRGAVDAYRATGLTRVGPGAAEAMNKITAGSTSAPFKALDSSAAFIQGGKDPRDLYTEAVANALKDISPTAAQMTGSAQPNYAALNPNEMLARTRWTPGGTAPPAAAAAAAAAAAGGGGAPPVPGGTVTRGTLTVPDTDPWADFIRRDQADRAAQLQQGPYGQLARSAGINVNDLMGAAASTGMSPYDYLQMTGEYRPTAGFPEPEPVPAPSPVQTGTAAQAPAPRPIGYQNVPVRRAAPAAAAPPAPTGEAYYPTEVGGPVSMPAPYAPDYGLGTPTYPYEVGGPVETAAPAAPVEYTPPEYQFPGFEGAMNAARAAYRAVPRVQFGPGGWRRPY